VYSPSRVPLNPHVPVDPVRYCIFLAISGFFFLLDLCSGWLRFPGLPVEWFFGDRWKAGCPMSWFLGEWARLGQGSSSRFPFPLPAPFSPHGPLTELIPVPVPGFFAVFCRRLSLVYRILCVLLTSFTYHKTRSPGSRCCPPGSNQLSREPLEWDSVLPSRRVRTNSTFSIWPANPTAVLRRRRDMAVPSFYLMFSDLSQHGGAVLVE